MSPAFSTFRLVQLYQERAANDVLAVFDVDLTLRDTMCTDTPADQRAQMVELYDRTEGGVILMSGRSAAALDETFDGALPLSGEHHSCMRIEQGGAVISLAPEVDTQLIADTATQIISELIIQKHDVVNDPQIVRDHACESSFALYPEVKKYAVALVHSLDHDPREIAEFQGKLKLVGAQVLKALGLEDTHEVRAGSDAVELVAKGLTPEMRGRLITAGEIPLDQVELMVQEGLHKGTGIHNFMSLSDFAHRTPYVVGDSGTDGVAMVEAAKYGGGGVWVLNGNTIDSIKPDHKEAVAGRFIESFNITWDHIGETLDHLRDKQKVYEGAAVLAQAVPNNTRR